MLLSSELAGGLAGLAPAGIKLGHEGVETLVVAGLQQVAELVDYYVLDAPIGQKQGVGGDADLAGADIALAPTGLEGTIGDGAGLDTHLARITLYQWTDDSGQTISSGTALGSGGQGQLGVEIIALLDTLQGALTGCDYPVGMLADKGLDNGTGQTHGG